MKKIFILTVLFVGIFFISCGDSKISVKKTFLRMDTVVNITVVVNKNKQLSKFWSSIDSFLVSWENRFSQLGENSEVNSLNLKIGKRVNVSDDLFQMLNYARMYEDSLDGDFNLTVFPLKELWGFGEDDDSLYVPNNTELMQVLKHINRNYLEVDSIKKAVFIKDSLARIDVGGIAKGLSLAKLANITKKYGIKNYLISAGGDIILSGKPLSGRSWYVGIQNPRDRSSLSATVRLDSGSIVTSGDYERFYIKNGQRYHHIFNTKTGYCCLKNQSLTIWSMNPMEADVLSTGLFCRKWKDILSYINKRAWLKCVVIDNNGVPHISNNWKTVVNLR